MIIKGGLVISQKDIEFIEASSDASFRKLCDLLDEKVQVKVSPAVMLKIKQKNDRKRRKLKKIYKQV